VIETTGGPQPDDPATAKPGECVPPMEETMGKIMKTFAVIDELLRQITEHLSRTARRDAGDRNRRTLG
jgi:hypothetical protein